MICKAIIEEFTDFYHARVRIPYYHKTSSSATGTKLAELPIAKISASVGCRPALKKGEIVFVAFENDEETDPIIIGVLYRDEDEGCQTNVNASSVTATVNCVLPRDTTIGDTTATDLKNLKGTSGNIQSQIDLIKTNAGCLPRATTTNCYENISPNTAVELNNNTLAIALLEPPKTYEGIYKVYWCPTDTPTYNTPSLPTGYSLVVNGSLPTWTANKIYELVFTKLTSTKIGLTVTQWG